MTKETYKDIIREHLKTLDQKMLEKLPKKEQFFKILDKKDNFFKQVQDLLKNK